MIKHLSSKLAQQNYRFNHKDTGECGSKLQKTADRASYKASALRNIAKKGNSDEMSYRNNHRSPLSPQKRDSRILLPNHDSFHTDGKVSPVKVVVDSNGLGCAGYGMKPKMCNRKGERDINNYGGSCSFDFIDVCRDINRKGRNSDRTMKNSQWKSLVQDTYPTRDIEESSDSGLYDMGVCTRDESSMLSSFNYGIASKAKCQSTGYLAQPTLPTGHGYRDSKSTLTHDSHNKAPTLTSNLNKARQSSLRPIGPLCDRNGTFSTIKLDGVRSSYAPDSNYGHEHNGCEQSNPWFKARNKATSSSNLYEAVYCKTFPAPCFLPDDPDTENISNFIDQNYDFDELEQRFEDKLHQAFPVDQLFGGMGDKEDILNNLGDDSVQELEAHINMGDEAKACDLTSLSSSIDELPLFKGMRDRTHHVSTGSLIYDICLPLKNNLRSKATPIYDLTTPNLIKSDDMRSSRNVNDINGIYESIRSSSRASSSVCSKCRCKVAEKLSDHLDQHPASSNTDTDSLARPTRNKYIKKCTTNGTLPQTAYQSNLVYPKVTSEETRYDTGNVNENDGRSESRYWIQNPHNESSSLYFTHEEIVPNGDNDRSTVFPSPQSPSSKSFVDGTKNLAFVDPSRNRMNRNGISQHLSYSTSVIDSLRCKENELNTKYRSQSPSSVLEGSLMVNEILSKKIQTLPGGYENRKQQYESNWSLMRPPKQFNVRFEDLDIISTKWDGYVPEANYDIILKGNRCKYNRSSSNILVAGLKRRAKSLMKYFKMS